ncbi:hypothetical protein X975_12859, partial [Stegodyphus mimosarum]
MDSRKIVKDLHSSLQNENLKREHLISLKDIANIQKQFHIPSCNNGFTFGDDIVSVRAWVNSMKEKNCVLLYKEQGDQHETLPKEDFMLVIMDPMQQHMLSTFGCDRVCVDSTFGLTGYGFELVSIIVIDKFEEGFPAAFCCCSSVNINTMTEFFKCLKQKVSIISTKTFMSDDTPIFYKAWEKIFGIADKRLLCAWHVDRAWQGHINSIRDVEKQKNIYKALKSALYELNESIFKNMLNCLLDELEEDKETKDFATYLQKYYVPRTEQWAYCFRKQSRINTNMHVESFHKIIKHIYLEGKKTKRVDKCIDALLSYLTDKKIDRLTKMHKGKITSKISNISRRHKDAKFLQPEKIDDRVFKFESSSLSRSYYVKKNSEHDCNEHCLKMCRKCNICIQAYTCECIDFNIQYNLCKHIHSAVMNNRNETVYSG